jgi:hypothetical protein
VYTLLTLFYIPWLSGDAAKRAKQEVMDYVQAQRESIDRVNRALAPTAVSSLSSPPEDHEVAMPTTCAHVEPLASPADSSHRTSISRLGLIAPNTAEKSEQSEDSARILVASSGETLCRQRAAKPAKTSWFGAAVALHTRLDHIVVIVTF